MGSAIFDSLYINPSGVQLTLLFCFLSSVPNGFSVCVFSSQSESVANLLLIHFYFKHGRLLLFRPSLSHSVLPYRPLPPLSLFACLDSLSHICSFPFHRPVVDQLISLGNNSQLKQSTCVPNILHSSFSFCWVIWKNAVRRCYREIFSLAMLSSVIISSELRKY